MHRIYSLLLCSFSIISAGILITGCKGKSASDKPRLNPPVIVDVMVASPQKISNLIEANGTVIANESVELHPEVSGRLT
ncbi:MAG: efflux RND transporter periplasmic adaptor subunit, partial [Chitinophagaceae bacterium]